MILNQMKNTSFRKGKVKSESRTEFYGIAKDSSGNFRMQVSMQKRLYDFTYLNGKLARIWVVVDAPKKEDMNRGYYYFKEGEVVYKEETRPNLIDIEETKGLGEELLRKARTL
jgi:hypothetical protein